MKTCAFTIILNGIHHLVHNNYAEKISSSVDYWVIVEGAASNNGSTKWCHRMLPWAHENGRSNDGTHEYLQIFVKNHPNTYLITKDGCYKSKDEQVELAIEKIRTLTNEEIFLWQIDCDEQWTRKNMRKAEQDLLNKGYDTGRFYWNFYVGPGLIVRGTWGEQSGGCGVARLWKWNGNKVISHEPPKFEGLNSSTLLSQRCNHFAYFFEKDVKFKSFWYNGNQNLLNAWKELQKIQDKKIPISALLSGTPTWKNQKDLRKTHIERMDQSEFISDWS